MTSGKQISVIAAAMLLLHGCASSPITGLADQGDLSIAYSKLLATYDAQRDEGKSGIVLISALSPYFAPEMNQSFIDWAKSDERVMTYVTDPCGHIDSRGCFKAKPNIKETVRTVENGLQLGCLQWTGETEDGTTLVRSMQFQRVEKEWRFININYGYFMKPNSSNLADFQAKNCWADKR